jgi:hypothetical protein
MILGSHLLAEAATTPLSNSPPRSPPRSAANLKPQEFSNTAMENPPSAKPPDWPRAPHHRSADIQSNALKVQAWP